MPSICTCKRYCSHSLTPINCIFTVTQLDQLHTINRSLLNITALVTPVLIQELIEHFSISISSNTTHKMHSTIISAFIATLAITGTVAGPLKHSKAAKRQTFSISCAKAVSDANQTLREGGALISGEPFNDERLPTNEAQCPGIMTFMNAVAAENGLAATPPFPLPAPFVKRQGLSSCEEIILEANNVLVENEAAVSGVLFTGIFPPSNEAGCQNAMTFLNNVAAEAGLAATAPFPLDAPF